MPYIKPEDRKRFNTRLENPIIYLVDEVQEPGDVNYIITKFIHELIERRGLRYAVLNELIGILECAKLELYRTVVAPYEDKKRKENGSVSELDKEK